MYPSEAGQAGAISCGDGNIDATEECDDGANNDPGKSCNASCKHNVCGDGDPGPGEGCDKGADNHIKLGPEHQGGNLQPNPVGTADASSVCGHAACTEISCAGNASSGIVATRRCLVTPGRLVGAVARALRPPCLRVRSRNRAWCRHNSQPADLRDKSP